MASNLAEKIKKFFGSHRRTGKGTEQGLRNQDLPVNYYYNPDELLMYRDSAGLEGFVCGSNKFGELKMPQHHELDSIKQLFELKPDEESYWNDMKQRAKAQFGLKDHEKKIEFYLEELKAVEGRFEGRTIIKRELKYNLGQAYECLATFTLKDKEPLLRSEYFERAVQYYQGADELVGFHTDCVLRQVESCFGVASYRMKAGITDEVTEQFAQRGNYLLKIFLGENVRIVGVADKKTAENVKQMADGQSGEGPIVVYNFRKPETSKVN